MTFKEACETGMPFIVRVPSGREYQFLFTDEGLIYIDDSGDMYNQYALTIETACLFLPSTEVLDWFEPGHDVLRDWMNALLSMPPCLDFERNEETKCTCDFVTQILPYGCKCGGK